MDSPGLYDIYSLYNGFDMDYHGHHKIGRAHMVQLSLYYFDGSSICSGKSKSCWSISISGVSSMIGGKDPWFLDKYVRDHSDHRCLFPTSWSVTRWVTRHGRTIRQIMGFRIYQSLINMYFALGTSDCSQICPAFPEMCCSANTFLPWPRS